MSTTFRMYHILQFFNNIRRKKMMFFSNIVLFLTYMYITDQLSIADSQKYEIMFGSYAYIDAFEDFVVIETVHGVSFEVCKKLCSRRYDCRTLNYHVKAHICYNLLDYIAYTSVYEIQKRSTFILAEKIQSGSDSNIEYTPYNGCGPLPYVDQTHKLGNMRSVGSKVKYVCDEREDKSDVIQCLTDYNWSMTSLSCDIDDKCINVFTWASCYKITTITSYWDTLKYDCEMIGGHLADITDDNEMQHVIDYLESERAWIGMSKVFIGMNNRKNMSEYRRMNEEIATYFYGNNSGFVSLTTSPETNTSTAASPTTTTSSSSTTTNEYKTSPIVWPVASNDSVTEDDGSGRRYKRCVTMILANDLKWVKTDCEEPHASLCETEGDCDHMSCYWFEETRTPWLKAQKKCGHKDRHLADITNEEEMRFVARFLDTLPNINKTSNIYIGINNRENITEYRTTNDTVASYFNWLIESTTTQTTMYPSDSVNYGQYHKSFNLGMINESGGENDGTSDENGGSASQSTLSSSSRTQAVDPDQNGSLESGAAQERCVAIDLENDYNWVNVDCNDILKGLCEIENHYMHTFL